MLTHAIYSLLCIQKLPLNTVEGYLSTYRGDFSSWYDSLDVVPDDWKRDFFRIHLPAEHIKYNRVIISIVGEDYILSAIASHFKMTTVSLTASIEVKDNVLDRLSSDLSYFEKYKNHMSLKQFIVGSIPEAFNDDSALGTKQIVIDYSEVENIQKTDLVMLKEIEADKVKTLFISLMRVDEALTKINMPAGYRQYSFLSGYQLWWFGKMVDKLNDKSIETKFTIFDFNAKTDDREGRYLNTMIKNVMPIVEKMQGTSDIVTLIESIANILLIATPNTGVNLPVKLGSVDPEVNKAYGLWHTNVLSSHAVDPGHLRLYDYILSAFLALSRFHNIMKSAHVVFPSFHTEISSDMSYLEKFHTMYDYLYFSQKVIERQLTHGLPASIVDGLKPFDYNKPNITPGSQVTFDYLPFIHRFSSYTLVTLKEPIHIPEVLNENSNPTYNLELAYKHMSENTDPLTYMNLQDYYGTDYNIFRYNLFCKTADYALKPNIPSSYLSTFYPDYARTKILPTFIRLNNAMSDFNKFIEDNAGIIKLPKASGNNERLLVSSLEFSVILSTNVKFIKILDTDFKDDEDVTLEIIKIFLEPVIGYKTDNNIDYYTAKRDSDLEAEAMFEFMSNIDPVSNPEFAHLWKEVCSILKMTYSASVFCHKNLFWFERGNMLPPVLHPDKAKRYSNQAKIRYTKQELLSRRISRQAKGYFVTQDNTFWVLESGKYSVRYSDTEMYFENSEGYWVNSKQEIKFF